MTLEIETLPASGTAEQNIVLLHGWAGDREIWRPVLRQLRSWANVTLVDMPGVSPAGGSSAPPSLDALLGLLLDAAPPQAVYMGHSLGGTLALELAHRHPDRVLATIGVCCNPRFVEHGSWPGMSADSFEDFRQLASSDLQAALGKFASLQALGSPAPRTLVRALRRPGDGASSPHLLRGLEWLAALDQRAELNTLQQPQAHVFAEGDALVPIATAERMREQIGPRNGVVIRSIAGSGHLLPWEQSSAVADIVQTFLADQGLLNVSAGAADGIPKDEVAASFSQAATTYDSVAALQREVGEALLARLDQSATAPTRVLDLGCGTGHFAHPLEKRFPQAEYVGLDIAPGMVGYASARSSNAWRWVVGDAEDLPLASASVDVIFSSLAVQWCYRPINLFAELRRVLKPGCKCVFTTLGPQTLKELRASWAAVDAHQHVNEFIQPQRLHDAVSELSGVTLTLEVDTHIMRYQSVRELLDELKSLGAHNMNRNRQPGLTGRQALQGMLKAYESYRENGELPATYEVIYGALTRHE